MRNSKCNHVSVQKKKPVEEAGSLRPLLAVVFGLLFECLQFSPLDPSLIARPRATRIGLFQAGPFAAVGCKLAHGQRWGLES